MKRLFTLVVFVFCIVLSQAQDVVTLQDTDIYMFNPLPVGKDLRKSWAHHNPFEASRIIVQQYVPSDSVTVYGVALTFENLFDNGVSIFNSGMPYTAVIMERRQGRGDSVDAISSSVVYRPMQYVDSLPLADSSHIKRCLFEYRFDLPGDISCQVPCYEFYFNTPERINRMTDTFYVGRGAANANGVFFPSEYYGLYNSAPVTSPFYGTDMFYDSSDSIFNRLDFFSEGGVLPSPRWGFAFPIIGFRCKPLDEVGHHLTLSDVDGQGATVTWYNVEDGASYAVRLVDVENNTDTMVITNDTSYRFDNLPMGRQYKVQVRKQCRYTTVNYDTVVYSPWTRSDVAFSTTPDTSVVGMHVVEGKVFRVSPNPVEEILSVTFFEPTVDDGRLEIIATDGRLIEFYPVPSASTKVDLDVRHLPTEGYFLRLITSAGIHTARFIKQ